MKVFFGLLTASLLWALSASACSCDGRIIDCSYRSADIVFRGTVDFSNDDGTGTCVQKTLVRFHVGEIFKGLPSGTNYVWVDPGSFTSCYAEYAKGRDYLVFALAPTKMPADTAAITIAKAGTSSKPVPKEFTASNPPTIYLAPECTGTRDIQYPDFDNDVASLRRYATGAHLAAIVGQVVLAPNDPWSGKGRLPGVEVFLDTGRGVRRATTNSEGKFFFDEQLKNGSYTVITRYTGTVTGRAVLHVYSQECSHLFLFLEPIGRIQKR